MRGLKGILVVRWASESQYDDLSKDEVALGTTCPLSMPVPATPRHGLGLLKSCRAAVVATGNTTQLE